jgi:hypothetical protein
MFQLFEHPPKLHQNLYAFHDILYVISRGGTKRECFAACQSEDRFDTLGYNIS